MAIPLRNLDASEPVGDPSVLNREYRRIVQERDHWKRVARESQQKLSAVAATIQNPALTWKQRGARIAVALALEAQRPVDRPDAEFRVDMGELAKRAGFVPPTSEGDEKARAKAWKAGRKQAGQVLKEFAECGVIEGRSVEKDRDLRGAVEASAVVIQIQRPHVEVIRAAGQIGGTRALQKPRGVHTKIEPRCPECHSWDTDLRCRKCGIVKPTREILEELDRAEAEQRSSFQRLETLSTTDIDHRRRQAHEPGFQTLELGDLRPEDGL